MGHHASVLRLGLVALRLHDILPDYLVLVALHLGCILLFVGLTLDVEIFFDILRYVWLHTVYGDKMQLVSHFEG